MRQTDDYLMRQVQAVAAMIARVASLRIEGGVDEARIVLEQAYGALFAGRADLVRRLDAATAASLLGSPERIVCLAGLLEEEGRLEGNATLHQRAIELTREALRRDPENEAAQSMLDRLIAP